jgi:anhydro-N-acetylmuramic acid kinase
MRVIGLISGTSADGIDAALVRIQGRQSDLQVELQRSMTVPYPEPLRQLIVDVGQGKPLSAEAFADLDRAIAHCFAQAALAVQGEDPADLLGSHGQTIFHAPATPARLGYSWQLGYGEAIALETGLPTVFDFRRADIAQGGQGAPLVSAMDVWLLSGQTEWRCVQNLGGIGNVTLLPPRQQADWLQQVRGWDTGPANSLLDLAVHDLSQGQLTYDRDGAWAATGQVCDALLQSWLQDGYFKIPPPKSTGREYFSRAFWQRCREQSEALGLTAADLLATLTELTVQSIAHEYQAFLPQQPDRVLLCGGGARNHYLCARLARQLTPIPVQTTAEYGLDPDFREAIAFAVLAYWRWYDLPGNLPAVTGARQLVPLGAIALPPAI